MSIVPQLSDTFALRLRVAIVGFGAIVQAKYLQGLLKLQDTYEVVLVVVPSGESRRFAAGRFPAAVVTAELPGDLSVFRLDAALVFTPPEGREDTVARLLNDGLHVLAEKPLTLSSVSALRLAVLAEERSRLLLVAHTRRSDSTFPVVLAHLEGKRVGVARATTIETPWQPVAALAPVAKPIDPTVEFERPLHPQVSADLSATLGIDDEITLRYFRWVLAESMIHDIDLVRSVLGKATSVDHARTVSDGIGLTAQARFGDTLVTFQWIVADGLSRYDQTFEFLGADIRATLRYPSPFLLNTAATFTITEPSDLDPPGHAARRVTGSNEDAFMRLLREFANRIIAVPSSAGIGGNGHSQSARHAAAALRVAEAIALSMATHEPVPVLEAT